MPTPLAYRVFVIREEPNLASTEPCAVYCCEFQEEFITKSIGCNIERLLLEVSGIRGVSLFHPFVSIELRVL